MNTLEAELAEFTAWNKPVLTEVERDLLTDILELDQLSSGAAFAFLAYLAGKARAQRDAEQA